jgi:cobalt-precorrin 5A hydrolase
MKTAFITLSEEGAALIPRLRQEFAGINCFVHESVTTAEECNRFARIVDLTAEIFSCYQALVYAAPCGVVVRALAHSVESKLSDPAVVVVDVGARWAVSLLSGHEGGANDLAMRVANLFDAEPVVTTTTEAVKDLIVGVGCRRGVERERIIQAIEGAMALAKMPLSRVRLLATAEIKRDEEGLVQAAAQLMIPLRFISMAQLAACGQTVSTSEFVMKSVGVPAVAEPAALLAGRRTTLLLQKTIFNQVTVAIARENFTLSA